MVIAVLGQQFKGRIFQSFLFYFAHTMGRIRREVLKVEKMIERKELDCKERFWEKIIFTTIKERRKRTCGFFVSNEKTQLHTI